MKSQRLFRNLAFFLAAAFAFGADAQDKLAEYLVGAGDNIRITVFQNPDLTVETRVTENGNISYPLVGAVKIGGLTIPAAEQAIAKALKDGAFIQSPQVNISLLLNRGNQVSVLGHLRPLRLTPRPWARRSGMYWSEHSVRRTRLITTPSAGSLIRCCR